MKKKLSERYVCGLKILSERLGFEKAYALIVGTLVHDEVYQWEQKVCILKKLRERFTIDPSPARREGAGKLGLNNQSTHRLFESEMLQTACESRIPQSLLFKATEKEVKANKIENNINRDRRGTGNVDEFDL
ncbi:MAG TPA: hypothetical protein VFK44_05635 [Bacillales bacterium]|nr:hypothetical protein [Bacillales bacterium]